MIFAGAVNGSGLVLMVTYTFPARDNMPKVAMPEVNVIWYDGGMLPPRPLEMADGDMLGDEDGGVIKVKDERFSGTSGTYPEDRRCWS
jgi:hypothetical protein